MSDLVSPDGRYLDGRPPPVLVNSVRRPAGYVEITDPIAGNQGGDTLQCDHCQKHWIVQPGSGMKRGFCLKCNGPTCGKQRCETRCVPFEKELEQIEARGRRT